MSDAAQKLVEGCQGLVRQLAWKIHRRVPRQVELDDLIAYGNLGLAQAARDFDPSLGNQFTTYAYYRIRGAIFDGLGKMSWFKLHEYHASKYERMADEVLDVEADPASGRGSNHEEDAGWLSRVAGSLSVAYLASGIEGSAESQSPDLVDETTPDDHAAENELKAKLRELIDALPAEAGQLIKATYYEGLTLTEAGQRLGISKAWASRLHAKTLNRLACGLRLMGARDD